MNKVLFVVVDTILDLRVKSPYIMYAEGIYYFMSGTVNISFA